MLKPMFRNPLWYVTDETDFIQREADIDSVQMSDSYNHVFKQSYNAFHNELISGGSSGGEGALVGARGSIVGIGTDIGGEKR